MKTIKYIAIYLLAFPNALISGQQFWLTTNEFWGGPKTGITLINDSVFFVSTTNTVMQSTDEFERLELVLTASEIYTLYSTANGKIFAGGRGVVFFSDDLGTTWDSVMLNTTFPLKQFVENTEGDLFCITGIIDEGDGVFFSGDGGLSWEKRNSGLGTYLGCDKIAIDKNDRLYLATSDEAIIGYGGLYISDNKGLQWRKLSIGIDSISTSVRIGSTSNLTVLSNNNVYLSFWGSGGNYGVELNIYKNIAEVDKTSLWNVLEIKRSTNPGIDYAINNIYTAQNGDWYSSITEMAHKGGTCYSKDGKEWQLVTYGLGVDVYSQRNVQHFSETSRGRIFMIQYMDERIYRTDTSIVTGMPNPVEGNSGINIYPNPVQKGERFTLTTERYTYPFDISIYDMTGKELFYKRAYDSQTTIPAPVSEGIYIVFVGKGYKERAMKIVVN